MSHYREIKTGDDVAQFVGSSGRPVMRLGTAEGGLPLSAVKLGGDRKPAVLIKAGSHASEIAGVHAALTLVADGLSTPHEVHVIACGDPLGFGGYSRALSYAAGEELHILDDDECLSVLSRLGRRFYDGEHFSLFHVGEMVFAWVDQESLDARFLFYGATDELAQQDPRFRAEIAGRRIFFPNAVYHDDGYGPYDQGALVSLANSYGWVSNMNGFYDRYDAPQEVTCVRDFCNRVRPGMVIDLHESCINTRIPVELQDSGEELGSHFLILPPVHGPSFEAVETVIADAVVKGTRKAGFRCFTRDQLAAAWGYPDTDYYHGYVRVGNRGSMTFYQWATVFADASIVVEPRMDQRAETRVDIHIAAVHAALQAYARLMEDKSG